MTTQNLLGLIREYFDLEGERDRRSSEGKDDREERERLDAARLGLVAAVNASYPPAAEPVMTAAREFLHAEESLERCRSFGADVEHAAHYFERTRRELKDLLDDSDLREAVFLGCAITPSSASPTKRILVAVDDTNPAQWALRVAAQYAQALQGSVMLLHIVKPEQSVAEDFVTGQRLDILHRRQGRELLDVLQRSLPPSILSSRMLRMGYPADEIVSAAADWYADLIIIGTRGRGRLAQLLLGSTAEAVIRRATCPVLTVSHDPQPLQRPDEAKWVGLGADAATPESAHAG